MTECIPDFHVFLLTVYLQILELIVGLEFLSWCWSCTPALCSQSCSFDLIYITEYITPHFAAVIKLCDWVCTDAVIKLCDWVCTDASDGRVSGVYPVPT